MRTRGQAGAAVDTSAISTEFEIDEAKLHVLLDAPTAELVKDFFVHLTAKAEESAAVKAAKLRSDVELENTVRNHEAKTKALKSSLTKSQKEVEELRKHATDLGLYTTMSGNSKLTVSQKRRDRHFDRKSTN